jgi:hypothetical protein
MTYAGSCALIAAFLLYLLPPTYPNITQQENTPNSPPTPSLPPPPPPPLPPPPLLPQKLMFTGKASDNNSSKDEDVHVPDYEALAQDNQNWASRHVRTATMGVRHFRKFFGTSVLVMKKVGIWLTGTPSPPEKTTRSGRPMWLSG